MSIIRDPRDLRIPGPTPVPPQVMEALQGPMVPHRGEYFATLFADLQEQMKRIHGTTGDVYVLAGTGSAGWEASIVNTLNPGDKVLAIVNGNFGERFVTVAEAFGMNVVRLDAEWGKGIDVAEVRAKLAENPDVRAVLLTQNETSTGVLNPVKEIGEAVREHGALLFVDAVSGLPGAKLDMDAWNCDVVFSGSQKAFMCPPGLSIIAVGDRVWDYVDQATIPRYMLDFKRMRDALARGSTPSTAPLSLIYAIKAACDMMEAEGMDNVYKRHIA
jgi:aspartate aminotransferase-like enzyme